MAKIDKFMQARLDGMAYALHIMQTKGPEALKEECRKRHAVPVQFEVKMEAVDQVLGEVRDRLYNTIITLTYKEMHDIFGFGKVRLKRFKEHFEKDLNEITEVDPYGYRYLEFQDIAAEMNEQYDLDIHMEAVRDADNMNSRYMDLRASIPAITLLLEQQGYKDAAGFMREFFDDKFKVREND